MNQRTADSGVLTQGYAATHTDQKNSPTNYRHSRNFDKHFKTPHLQTTTWPADRRFRCAHARPYPPADYRQTDQQTDETRR